MNNQFSTSIAEYLQAEGSTSVSKQTHEIVENQFSTSIAEYLQSEGSTSVSK